ncbi:zinc finger protein 862-like isoform X2 [Haliotis asinina]|uniref:zinc finger protein 862-like isoform X2 n=1 Tax=Haliotis asinina TaxID=109174 RepID=UPI003531C6B8
MNRPPTSDSSTIPTIEFPSSVSPTDDRGDRARPQERRMRRFQPHWQDSYPWVFFDEVLGKMFCRICKENPDVSDPASAYFTGGCSNFQIMSLQSHAKSKGHISAEDVARMKSGAGVDVFHTWSPDQTSTDASSPSSSSGPAVAGHPMQFAHPIHLFTNNVRATHYKSTTDMINEGFRAMHDRLLKNMDTTRSEGSVFPARQLGSYAAPVQGMVKQQYRPSSTYHNTESADSPRESPGTSQMFLTPSYPSHKVKAMFLNAHAAAKRGMSKQDYVWMCDLDKAKGLDMGDHHDAKECQTIQKVIAKSVTNRLRAAIEKCRYFSVVCDTVRTRTADMLVFYIKTTERGKSRFYVVSTVTVEAKQEGCFSEQLEKALGTELDGINWKPKLIGVLHNVDMKWYEGKGESRSRTSGESLCEETTWPSDRLADVLVFTKKFSSIMGVLNQHENRSCPTIPDVMHFFKSHRFVKYIHFLSDLLGVLENASQTLGKSDTTIGEVYETISDTIDNVKKLQKRSGQQLVKVEKEPEFQGFFLSTEGMDDFETDREFILTSLVADLAPRLCDLQEGKMAAMAKLASLQQWPEDTEDLKDYADEDLLLIVESYSDVLRGSGVDTDKCLMEWSQLKNHVRRRFSSPVNTSWESIIPTCKGKCENVLAVLSFILTLPGQSVEVEKGFHYLQRRNKECLQAEEVCDQLRIFHNLPNIGEFDPDPYVDTWQENNIQDGVPPKKKARRITPEEDEEAYPVFFS